MVENQFEIGQAMKPIGGYFEWEFPCAKKGVLHENATYLNSGRHALEYILRGLANVKNLWIPYYTCDAVLQPLQRLGIAWKFYHINKKLEIDDQLELKEGEILLYTNYYGIKDEYCNLLAKMYGKYLIIDNAQALFCKAISGTNQFYSPRKFIGMPDGGLAIAEIPNHASNLPVDKSFERCAHLLKRLEFAPSEGYADFKENSKKLADSPLSQMSKISKSILSSIDLDRIKQARRENFKHLHKALASTNRLAIPPMDSFECPLIYPYWANNGATLKETLIEHEIFVATYWPNVFQWCVQNDLECSIANNMVCLPIDQRYGKEDMDRILGTIL